MYLIRRRRDVKTIIIISNFVLLSNIFIIKTALSHWILLFNKEILLAILRVKKNYLVMDFINLNQYCYHLFFIFLCKYIFVYLTK